MKILKGHATSVAGPSTGGGVERSETGVPNRSLETPFDTSVRGDRWTPWLRYGPGQDVDDPSVGRSSDPSSVTNTTWTLAKRTKSECLEGRPVFETLGPVLGCTSFDPGFPLSRPTPLSGSGGSSLCLAAEWDWSLGFDEQGGPESSGVSNRKKDPRPDGKGREGHRATDSIPVA